jgi:ribosomal protein L5
MRYEHYRRVVKRDRRQRYPERKHEVERPGVEKVTRMWGRKGVGYEPKYMVAAWSGLKIRTGQEPKRVYTKKSVAQRRLKEGDPVGCIVKVCGKEAYDRREERSVRVRPEVRPFGGLKKQGKVVDKEGKRTFHREQPGVIPTRTPYYEAYYGLRQGGKKGDSSEKGGRYRSVNTTAKTEKVGRSLREGRRVLT